MKKILVIIAVVGLLQLMIVSMAYAAAPPVKGNELEDTMQPDVTGQHTVTHGETLYSISRLYGISPQAIAQANGLHNPDNIYITQRLLIPTATDAVTYQPIVQPNDAPQYTTEPGRPTSHIVTTGETLYSIAQRYGVSYHAIAQANRLHNPDSIQATQRLFIPLGGGGKPGGEQDVTGSGGQPQQLFIPASNTNGNGSQGTGAFEAIDGTWVITLRSPTPALTGYGYNTGCGSACPDKIFIKFHISSFDQPNNGGNGNQGYYGY